jgi:FkbM family methyltransferase
MSITKSILNIIEYTSGHLGWMVIRKWRMGNLLLVKRLQRIIIEYQIDCIIDVGANTGQYGKFHREEVGYSGLIISFEPDPVIFKSLEETSQADDQWVIKNYALGKKSEKRNFNIMEGSTLNSFLDPDHTETSMFENENVIRETIEVPLRRLDDVHTELKEMNNFKRIFLKLDTQGFDLDVFTGSFRCLDQVFGIQTEVSVLPIYKDMPSFDDSLKLFRSKGFEVSGLYALSESRFPHAAEFDCIYLPK